MREMKNPVLIDGKRVLELRQFSFRSESHKYQIVIFLKPFHESLNPLAAIAATNHQAKANAAAINSAMMITSAGDMEERFCRSGGGLFSSNEHTEQ